MTTTISRDDVIHLAKLSNFDLSEEEIEVLQTDLGNILEYINQLSELDTSGVEPTYQVTDLENVGRDDVVAEPLADREALIALAPKQRNNQIEVPKVL